MSPWLDIYLTDRAASCSTARRAAARRNSTRSCRRNGRSCQNSIAHRHDAIARPVRRPRHACRSRISRCRARSPSRTRAGFPAAPIACWPRRRSAQPRAGGEIGVGLGVRHPLDRPAQAHLPVQRLPVEQQRRLRVGVELAALLAVDVGVEHRARARRSPSAAPSARPAGRRHRRSRAPWRWDRSVRRAVASSSQAAKSRKGSSAAVKSPAVNPAWVFYRGRVGHCSGVSRMAGPVQYRVTAAPL